MKKKKFVINKVEPTEQKQQEQIDESNQTAHQNQQIQVAKDNGKEQHQNEIKPFPIADSKFTVKLLDLLQQSFHYKQIKKGANEVIKQLNRGTCEIVVMAADTKPIEILMNLPTLCDEKNVPYCFVQSQAALGRACGIKRSVIATCIVNHEGSQLNSQIIEAKDQIEQLFI